MAKKIELSRSERKLILKLRKEKAPAKKTETVTPKEKGPSKLAALVAKARVAKDKTKTAVKAGGEKVKPYRAKVAQAVEDKRFQRTLAKGNRAAKRAKRKIAKQVAQQLTDFVEGNLPAKTDD